jgi:heterodisulfide reductase subunit A-like polyferredoxin
MHRTVWGTARVFMLVRWKQFPCALAQKSAVWNYHMWMRHFQSNIKGIFIAGELGGMGLIKNSVEQGQQAMESIAA